MITKLAKMLSGIINLLVIVLAAMRDALAGRMTHNAGPDWPAPQEPDDGSADWPQGDAAQQ
jgi:hypothetical protein